MKKLKDLICRYGLTLDTTLFIILGLVFLKFVFPLLRMIIAKSGKTLPEMSVIAFRICFFFSQHLYYLFLFIIFVGVIEFAKGEKIENSTKFIAKLFICFFYVYILFALCMSFCF